MTLTYFLKSNEAILESPFPDDNLLTIKGLDLNLLVYLLQTLVGMNYK